MLKIQFLNGGLANQAFQYIFARHHELSHPGEVMYLDDSYFALNTVHNGYELEKVFGIKAHMLSEVFDDDVWRQMLWEKVKGKSIPQIILENGGDIRMVIETDNNSFNPFKGIILQPGKQGYIPDIQNMPGNTYYHGYWIDKGWFMEYEDVFRKELTFPKLDDYKNEKLLDNITNGKSISVHVRRGDFYDLGWAIGDNVIRGCVGLALDNGYSDYTLYVFSDDINWCRKNAATLGFNGFGNTVYVEGNTGEKSYIDLQLMSHCKAMILSNSAFCFLASLLNEDLQYYVNPTSRVIR